VPDPTPQDLAAWLAALETPEAVYVPVRHHSPACAWQLRGYIRELRPSAVLIEGPRTFNGLVDLLLSEENVPPLAVYSGFTDSRRQTLPEAERGEEAPAPHYAAFYPFCAYSPEWVALQTGREIGARLEFIDLDYADQVLAESDARAEASPSRVTNLTHDEYLQHSRYLRELAQRSGCRDFDEFWDRHFESRLHVDAEPRRFFGELGAYCWFTRQFSDPLTDLAEANTAREAAMAGYIREALAQRGAGDGPVFVVTGGYHTVTLPALVAAKGKAPRPRSIPGKDLVQVPIRYSFAQLDRLNGYGSGMPAPQYYQSLWEAREAGHEEAGAWVARHFFTDLARLTRESGKGQPLSTADIIAAQHHCRLLASVRGSAAPTREDLLDAVRSCFIKGEIDVEGQLVLGLAERMLTGDRVGRVTNAGVLPIIEDFRARAAKARFNLESVTSRVVTLDIYRKEAHRETSRLLHALEFLGVPFGRLLAGPDFANQRDLTRLHEEWEIAWNPQTDAGLVEASIYGNTVVDAAAGKLREQWQRQKKEGEARNALLAAQLLVAGCRMGLHKHVGGLLHDLPLAIAEDPSFANLAGTVRELLLLETSREPLEARNLPLIPQLLAAAYKRACYLVLELAKVPPDRAEEQLEALGGLAELLVARAEAEAADDLAVLDAELFWRALEALTRTVPCEASLCGGAVGLLQGRGRLSPEQLAAMVEGYLRSLGLPWQERVAFIRGLCATCREVLWQSPALLESLHTMIMEWEEMDFLAALPQLRLAFAVLSPRESDRVGELAARLLGAEDLGPLYQPDLDEALVAAGTALSLRVSEVLRDDGLLEWLHGRDKEVVTP
jgi:hypothetical protein